MKQQQEVLVMEATQRAKSQRVGSTDDNADSPQPMWRREIVATQEDITHLTDKVRKLETLMDTTPQKRMKMYSSGPVVTDHSGLTEITERLNLLQDQYVITNDIQDGLMTQVQELEDWKKTAQQAYPPFESVEARIKEQLYEIKAVTTK